MRRFRSIGLLLSLLFVYGLAGCYEKPVTAPELTSSGEKRAPEIFGMQISPEYLQTIRTAADSIIWETVTVTVDLNGDSQTIEPSGWPNSRPFIVKIPKNSFRGGHHTFQIKYMQYNPLNPAAPSIPGDVTMYQFLDMPPEYYKLAVNVPPAPWYAEDLFDDAVWSYILNLDWRGELYASDLKVNYGTAAAGTTVFCLPVNPPNRPSPAVMIVDPEIDIMEPGDDS